MKPTKFENIVHQISNLSINIDIPANAQHCDNVVVWLYCRDAITDHRDRITTLLQCWLVSLTQGLFQMLYRQYCCNVEIATSNLQPLLDVGIRTLHQDCVSFAKNVKCGLLMVHDNISTNFASKF